MISRRRGVGAAVVALAALLFPAAAHAGPPGWLKVEDGVTQPIFSLDDAIEETLFVESVVDSDQDGRRDLVRIHISRPGETEKKADGTRIRVPVVFEHSPYRGDFGDAVNHPVDFDVLPQEFLRPRGGARRGGGTEARRGWSHARQRADLPGDLDNRYVPRGYAVILGEGIGSALGRLPHDRRPRRGGLDARGDRLAQRPRPRLRRRRAARACRLDDRRGRDDGRLL